MNKLITATNASILKALGLDYLKSVVSVSLCLKPETPPTATVEMVCGWKDGAPQIKFERHVYSVDSEQSYIEFDIEAACSTASARAVLATADAARKLHNAIWRESRAAEAVQDKRWDQIEAELKQGLFGCSQQEAEVAA